MSLYVHLMPDRRIPMRDVAAAAPRGVGGKPAHLLWPRKTLFRRQAAKSFPGAVARQRSCSCSILLVRFLIWATRNAPHRD
jgi:hypothetical protein